jgi:hypothetical protein
MRFSTSGFVRQTVPPGSPGFEYRFAELFDYKIDYGQCYIACSLFFLIIANFQFYFTAMWQARSPMAVFCYTVALTAATKEETLVF